MEVYIARQAILDRNLALFGYELLYRSSQRNSCGPGDDSSITLHLLANSVLTSGLEVLACNAPVFINFGEQLLTSEFSSIFPPDKVVIEILESVRPNPEVISACLQLKKMGYLLALDDVAGERPSDDQLAALANFIKVDFHSTSREEQIRLARSFTGSGRRLIAEKVETHEEFLWAKQAGYDYFQGFFFARPTVLKGQQIPSVKSNALRLLRELQKSELDFKRLETIIKCDIALTYKLFRYVNSALFTRPNPTASIADALVLMGEVDIRRWITLVTLPALAMGSSRELIVHALVRAKFCEQLATVAHVDPPNDAFLVGMFSLLDALLNRPMAEILLELNLPRSVGEALLGTAGRTGVAAVYEIARHYEAGDWDSLDELVNNLFLGAESVTDSYIEAVAWANETFGVITTDPPKQFAASRNDLLAVQRAVLKDSVETSERTDNPTMLIR